MKTGTKIILGLVALGAMVGGYFLLKRRPQFPTPTPSPVSPTPEDGPTAMQWMGTVVSTADAKSLMKHKAYVTSMKDLPEGAKWVLAQHAGSLDISKPTIHTVQTGSRTSPSYTYVADFSRFSGGPHWFVVEKVSI